MPPISIRGNKQEDQKKKQNTKSALYDKNSGLE